MKSLMNTNICSLPLTVLLEPTADCNLRCLHCYHATTKYSPYKMKLNTLRTFLDKAVKNYHNISIIWHGGEPLLMGYDFFKSAYALFEEYQQIHNVKFKFSLQTNGTLLTDKLIDLFNSTGTLISFSYDGSFNNVLRQETEKVESAIMNIKKVTGNVNCLSCISSESINHLIKIYQEFNAKGYNLKLSPTYVEGAAVNNRNLTVDETVWTNKFIELFEFWLYDKNCRISLQPCMNILRAFLGKERGECKYHGCLFQFLALDAYGNLFPCGRLIRDELKICNIFDIDSLAETFVTDNYKKYFSNSCERAKKCKNCKWFAKCHSGCNASSYWEGDIKKASKFDCCFTQKVFAYLEKRISNIQYDNLNEYAKKILESK